MNVIDVSQLLQEVSPASPCGANLEFDPAFRDLESAATGKPERRMGESVIPGEEPTWGVVKSKALDLFRRTKDLRVAVELTRSLLHTDGAAGLRDGLMVVGGLLERYWDGVHPQLDPEDGKDPTLRVNTLAALSAWDGMVRGVREMPLVQSRALGRYSLRDIEIATGVAPKPEGDGASVPEMSVIQEAFLEVDVGEVRATAEGVSGALENLGKIGALVAERVGAAGSVDLTRLTATLETANHILAEQLARRGSGPAPGGDAVSSGAGGARPRAIAGEIATREDVVRLLDMACEYFKRHEPSSPVPLLLQRAKRLVSKDFLEIVKDLAPGGVAEVKSVGGLDSEE